MQRPLLESYEHHLVLDAGGWSERRQEHRGVRSRLFLEGMRELGLQAANIAGRDLLVGREELERMIGELGVDFVSANVRVDGELLVKPYIVLNKRLGDREVRIGITGVTIRSRAASEAWSGNLEFTDPDEAAREMLEMLRPQTDIRILLAHMTTQQLEELVSDMPFGYDLLVSSTGELREMTPIGATPVVLSPGTRGKRAAWVRLRFERAGNVMVTGGEVLGLDKKIEDDPEMAARVATFKETLAALQKPAPTRVTTSGAPEAPASSTPP